MTLDPVTEVMSLHRLASRPTRCCRPCFINPGDVTLMTVPGYPVAGTCTRSTYGGEVHPPAAAGGERLLPRPRRHPGRHQEAGEAAGHQLPEQPDRGGGDDATSTSGSSTSPTRTRSSIVQDAAHILLSYDGDAAELPAGGRGEGGRRRGSLDVEGLQHDRLAASAFVCGPPEDRAGLRRREGQQRLRASSWRSSTPRRRRLRHARDRRSRSARSTSGGWRSWWRR